MMIVQLLRHNVAGPAFYTILQIFSSPIFYFGLAAILTIEHFFPAKSPQKTFSAGFSLDSLWLIQDAVFDAVLITAYVNFLTAIYQQHLGFLTITAVRSFPIPLQFLIAFLVSDFLNWGQHWIRHKVPWFWKFHAVHHSQHEMNLFTDSRSHPVDEIIARTIDIVPFLIIGAKVCDAVWYNLFMTWFTRLYHANIRANYGLLKYILVTPQSHRVHHSIEPRHFDKNFGTMLSVWDHIFGTQHRGYDEYPDTGIPDKNFPLEQNVSRLHLIQTAIRQHLYPFREIAGSIMRLGRGRSGRSE